MAHILITVSTTPHPFRHIKENLTPYLSVSNINNSKETTTVKVAVTTASTIETPSG
jgi:hypothetical protein